VRLRSAVAHTGTGKTSTIVHAIRALVASGASVLVAAYTNSALDNILIKLADSGVHQFLRLGRASSCHSKMRQYMPGGER
jgi:DNA replication ATP-dependent helicase Dna2